MRHRPTKRSLLIDAALCAGVAIFCVLALPAERPPLTRVLGRESSAHLQALATPHALSTPLIAGFDWAALQIDRHHADFVLQGEDEQARVRLRHPDRAGRGEKDLLAPHMALELLSASPEGQRAARTLAEQLAGAAADGGAAEIWRVAHDETEGWSAAAAATAALERPSEPIRQARALWLALFALLAWAAMVRLRALWRPRTPADAGGEARDFAPVAPWLLGATLFLGSLALGFSLANFGPGDQWFNQAEAFGYVAHQGHYGAAPPALLQLVMLVAPTRFETVIATNLVLGALAPLLLVFALRALAASPLAAWAAGAILAMLPTLVRFAGDGNRQPTLLVLTLMALLALCAFLRDGRPSQLATFVLAGFLALWSRPEALLAVPLWGAALVAAPLAGTAPASGGTSWTARLIAALSFVGLMVWWGLHVLPDQLSLYQEHSHPSILAERLSPARWLWPHPAMMPVAVTALACVGGIWALLTRSRWWGLLFGVLLVQSFVVGAHPTGPHTLVNARYHTLTLIAVAGLAGFAAERLAQWVAQRRPRCRPAALVAALVIVAAATAVSPLRHVRAPRTEDVEFAFLRRHAPALGPDAKVLFVYAAGDFFLKELALVPLVFGLEQAWVEVGSPHEATATHYYHAASCSHPGLPPGPAEQCRDAARRFAAAPVVATRIAARGLDGDSHGRRRRSDRLLPPQRPLNRLQAREWQRRAAAASIVGEEGRRGGGEEGRAGSPRPFGGAAAAPRAWRAWRALAAAKAIQRGRIGCSDSLGLRCCWPWGSSPAQVRRRRRVTMPAATVGTAAVRSTSGRQTASDPSTPRRATPAPTRWPMRGKLRTGTPPGTRPRTELRPTSATAKPTCASASTTATATRLTAAL
jgi:hypothetical protein